MDVCSHGRPNHIDLITELRDALGHDRVAIPLTPEEVWRQAIDEVRSLRRDQREE